VQNVSLRDTACLVEAARMRGMRAALAASSAVVNPLNRVETCPQSRPSSPTAAPEFLPEAEQPISGVTASIKENSYNRWLKGLSAEQRQKIRALPAALRADRRNEGKPRVLGARFTVVRK
jgi:hypothetical protein